MNQKSIHNYLTTLSNNKEHLESLYILKIIQKKYTISKIEYINSTRDKINFIEFCKYLDTNNYLNYNLLPIYINDITLSSIKLNQLIDIINCNQSLPKIDQIFKNYSPDFHAVISNQII